MHKVSIIVPIYKVEQYLRTCIESVLAQTYGNWELILCDDGSPDGCPGICDGYASEDSRIRTLHLQNGGIGRARNCGIAVSTGDIICFLDSDDFIHPKYLEIMLGLMDRYDADIVQCGFIRGTEKVFPQITIDDKSEVHDRKSLFLKRRYNCCQWGKIFRRHIIESDPVKDVRSFEDEYTTWRHIEAARSIVVNRTPLYYYTVRHDSIIGSQKKRTDWSFMNAHFERAEYYRDRGEQDLVDNVLARLCQSIVLTYGMRGSTTEELADALNIFNENWTSIRSSRHLSTPQRLLFAAFHCAPLTTSRLAIKMKSSIGK